MDANSLYPGFEVHDIESDVGVRTGHSQSEPGQLGTAVSQGRIGRCGRWRQEHPGFARADGDSPVACRECSPSHGARHRKKSRGYLPQDTLRGTPGFTK